MAPLNGAPDLQAEALQQLSDMIDNLCSLTERKRAACENPRWKLEYNGQQVILRDVVD